MKYVILNFYREEESNYHQLDMRVRVNGQEILVLDTDNEYSEIMNKYLGMYTFDFVKWIKEKYKDYDLVILCENGYTNILIDKTTS